MSAKEGPAHTGPNHGTLNFQNPIAAESPCQEAALRYAELGYAVLPLHSIQDGACTCGKTDCASPGKHPRIPHGVKGASTDADLIREWWKRSRNANVGLRCDRFVALDVDPRHNGDHALAGLLAAHGGLPDTPHQFSGGSGHHYLFAQPDPPIGNRKLLDGLEVKGAGGYVCAEPSNHASGGRYIFEDGHALGDLPLAPLPGWLLDLIRTKPKAPAGNGRAPRKASGLLLSIDRRPDAEKLDALLANDPKILATWEKRRPDLKDSSPSGYDQSLANFARSAGWTNQEVVDLLTARRVKHGDEPEKMLRADYVEVTLGKARTGVNGTAQDGADGKDVGLTKALSDAILTTENFAVDPGGRLYRFTKGAYRPDGEAHVKRAVKSLLESWKQPAKWTIRRQAEVAEYIRVDAPELWERPPLDKVNVLNGLLDVNTRTLTDHEHTHLSPVQLPVRFDPDAKCPAWERFVAEVFPGDAVGVAWELLAWLMLPWTDLQKAALLIGEGANGKSTFLRAVTTFVGKMNVAGVSLHRLEADRFSAARLIGRLANICADLPSRDLDGTSAFKAIVGGDSIVAERKHVDSFDFVPFCRLIFSANNPPKSNDSSSAFFRRWIVIPFERTFEPDEVIPSNVLDAKLSDPAELSGALNKALDALARLQEQNGFTESQSMRRAWDELRECTDPVAVWLQTSTVRGPECVTPKGELLAAYNRAAAAAGRPLTNKTAFGLAVRRLCPDLKEGQRVIHGVHSTWCWLGIGLPGEGAGGWQ